MTGLGVKHVIRPALPWREEAVTECGRTGLAAISRAEFLGLLRSLGKQRTALQVCMNCFYTAERHLDWEHSPAEVMGRVIYREEERVSTELRAIALLIEAHRDEFDLALADLAAAVPLRPRKAR